jgi:hypothetical protein
MDLRQRFSEDTSIRGMLRVGIKQFFGDPD